MYKIVSSCVASRKRKAEIISATFETPNFNSHQQLSKIDYDSDNDSGNENLEPNNRSLEKEEVAISFYYLFPP